jgi:uncharacterized membrane protein YbhN (UPF0104 family)
VISNALAFAVPAALLLGAAVFLATRGPSAYISGRTVFTLVVFGWVAVGSAPTVLVLLTPTFWRD